MTHPQRPSSRLVYSTESGGICAGCKKKLDRCACRKRPPSPLGDGIVRVGRSTRGRKGKGVTVISGVPLDAAGLKRLARTLKQQTGSGGTVKDGIIEIQGDHRDVLVFALRAMGYTVRRSGG